MRQITRKVLTKILDRENIKIIRQSSCFDADYYLRKYPDVAASGSDPANHYYYRGWIEGRNPSEGFSNNSHRNENLNRGISMNPVVYYEITGKYIQPSVNTVNLTDTKPVSVKKKAEVYDILNDRFSVCKPLKSIYSKNSVKRLNIVFNGFRHGDLFGGKATALITAILFADRYDYSLRIIAQAPEHNLLNEFLDMYELPQPKKVEYFSTDYGTSLEISDKDIFLCTMWSNADSVLNTPLVTGKIFYIMQEVETFFYDHGDDHLRCRNVLSDMRIIPIVNSKLLYDYLINDGYENVRQHGVYFEPVFSEKLLKPSEDSFTKKDKYKLFFYGRPTHQRNVFYFGLECLNEAFLNGKLDPSEWVVYTAGDNTLPEFKFDSAVEVKRLGVMNWLDYCEFVSGVDLCYSMIYTPHPSYPPLDTTTAGAVCVTNRYANKQDLSNYSENIIMADLNKTSMLDALEKGAALAKNPEQRKKNYEHSHTKGNWTEALDAAVSQLHNFVEDEA